MTDSLEVDVSAVPRHELPTLLGKLTELEARVRLRLAEVPQTAPPSPPQLLGADDAADVAGTSRRWLLAATRGRAFRRDLSRKQPRFDEAGLRSWLAQRRTR